MARTRFEIATPVIEAELAKPYAYGSADCFMLGCRVADALDPSLGLAAAYAGAYSTYKGAQRAMLKRGHTSIADVLDKHLLRCSPASARYGDLVVLQFPDGEHVGTCVGNRFVTKLPRTHAFRGMDAVIVAFAVA